MDAAKDAPADIAKDAPAPDQPPPMDAPDDVAPDAPPPGCTGSRDCAPGEYCTAARRCESGCGDDTDCAGDGGLTRCDPVRHACARCASDDHCPAGEVCQLGSCAPGCTAAHACAVGRSCCAGTCLDLTADPAHCGACATTCASGDNATAACAAGRCGFTCEAGYGDCDGDAMNGCEANFQTSARNCRACGLACAAGLDCRGGLCTPAYTSCRAVLDAGLSTGDGVYTVLLGGVPTQVRCLMSADGGGWTLAGNFPNTGGTAGVAGWTSGARVGTSFTDLARPFKLSDAAINALRTTGFRARGTATRCVQGPCTVDTTLYWRPTCLYASGSNSPACYTAFRDAAFTVPESASAPCSWHWGLVASDCSTTATMGTSHVSEHVFVGNYRSYVHAYDGRAGEDPSVQFWVR